MGRFVIVAYAPKPGMADQLLAAVRKHLRVLFMVLDTKEDADTMMVVFKAHSALCYVGRNNKRTNRGDYMQEYWK